MEVELCCPIFDAAPDAIVLLDADGRISRSNEATTTLFGYLPEELQGQSFNVLVPESVQASEVETVLRTLANSAERAKEIGTEFTGRTKAGDEVPVAIRIGAIDNPKNFHYVCVFRDITERRRVQEELDRFFELSLDMFCIAGLDGYFRRLNPAWQRTLGFTVDELMAEPFLSFVHPEDRELTRIEVQRLASGVDTIAFENRYRCKNGSYRWILWNSTPFLNEKLILAIAHDITDRKQAEEQLRLQNLRLQEIARSERQAHEALKLAEVHLVQSEKLSALGQLVAGVAHEINNPLAYISNNIAILRRDLGELRQLFRLYQGLDELASEYRPEMMETIQEHSDRIDLPYVLENLDGIIDRTRDGLKRIQAIVKDLQDFARLDSEGLHEVNLNDCVHSTVNMVVGRAEQQGVEVVQDLEQLAPISCDPGKVNQVLLNLLTNALDACPHGGKVTVRTRSLKNGTEIHVIDTGIGIDPTTRDKIFDPFFTTKPIGKGTGLGLSISYGIVRQHGGEIAVESIPGQGTHFTVFLPLVSRGMIAPPPPTIPIQKCK